MGIGNILSVIENVNIASTGIALVSVNVIVDEIANSEQKKTEEREGGIHQPYKC